MMLAITRAEFATLTPGAQAELMRLWNGSTLPAAVVSGDATPFPPEYAGIDMEDVHDLTPRMMADWMEAAADKTKAGLRVFAEHGPIVTVRQLKAAGIDNIAHFQSRTTIRTRTVTGHDDAFLLGWEESWEKDEDKVDDNRYAVTPMTHQSLRRYFKL